ncbi:Hypothetical predicted protein [Olea europaea subsp. europaea]|uniref:DUF1985 domain-containing protein n=1 Tax=Olea europaea subsp. europaea TaxID=158383 RepID=A0A8S0V2D0_OLEEU|nr:Hypothetical predicted protein [Olea europaea subsp. europaea]
MNFGPLVPENARLLGHISQRSNLRYVKIVVEHFDERQREDFRSSCLGFLSEVLDLQFSAYLIQQLVFCCIRTDKRHELWFNLQGHLARFGIQEYFLVTGLRCCLLLDDNVMERVLDKRRLIGADISPIVNAFSQSLHVYAMLRPTEVERGQPHIATLVPFDDRPVPALDDLVRDSIALQFHAERLGTPAEGTSEDETSDEAHEGSGTSGEEEESRADDSGEVEGEDLEDHDGGIVTAPPTSYARPTAMAGSSLMIDDVQGMLLDQRILIEMWLRIVKLEIMQHVSDEFKKLKDFISPVVPASGSTTTARAADVDPEPRQSNYGGFADYVGHHSSCDGPNKDMGIDRQEGDAEGGHHPSPGNRDEEQDMLSIGTEHLQDTTDIEPCPDNDPMPVPAGTNEVQGIPSFIGN